MKGAHIAPATGHSVAISVKNVSKQFSIPHEKTNTLKGAFINLFRKNTYEKFFALKDVSFEVRKGEFFGILGRNGSGKSTLLKILAGVYTANQGSVHIHGLISPFLELGIGFNPELSGRDNIYLNATVLGLCEREIDAKFDSIVAFSELERFIDQKVKNYSSGMNVRLAFAVAIHANREILLMDEVLAVGDSNFQSKCLREFARYKELGKTVVLVTHDTSVVQKYCDRAMILRNGEIVMIGDAQDVGDEYVYQNMSDEERRVMDEKNLAISEEKKGAQKLKVLAEERKRLEEERQKQEEERKNNFEIYKYFFNGEYQRHNVARLQHLESLNLDLDGKKVIEFGAGIGDHSMFYLIKNCKVYPTDGRSHLADFISKRFGVDTGVIDAEKDQEAIKKLPNFDIIHCYGFLYHISNPAEFLNLIKDKAPTLLLETCVSSDKKNDDVYLTSEFSENITQAISGTGCRPTRRWIMEKLKENYKYVYVPKTQPKHKEFPLNWNSDFTDDSLIGAVFIASNYEIKSPHLQTELPIIYKEW